MVVALFALSLVMVVGGVAAVIQGFPYVRLESGLAMVVGGATAASAGVILLGLSAVVARLKRIEVVLAADPASGRAASGQVGPATAPVSVPATSVVPGPVVPDFGTPPERTSPPALAGTAGLAGIALAGAAAIGGSRRGAEPTFDSPTPAHPAAPTEAAAEPATARGPIADPAVEPLLPDLLPPEPYREPHAVDAPGTEPYDAAVGNDRPHEEAAPPGPAALHDGSGEDDLFASGRPDPAHDDALGLRPALAETPTEPDAEVAPDAEPAERQVVGTYASGGNTYVMYADGSIQADTPRGLFRFDSLDELKAFVDSGGEADARGAA